MAQVFAHPLSLIYQIGKNLIVNGIDIFKKIYSAVSYYKNGDYFNFGRMVGEALAETILGNPQHMAVMDSNAYEFLDGFLTASP